MKSMVKKVVVLSIILVLVALFAISTRSYAYEWMTEINSQAAASVDNGATTSAKSIGASVITIARVVTAGIAVIMLVILAMKYMMAAPGERADIKKHAVVYIVGAIIMFASTGILGIIQEFASTIS